MGSLQVISRCETSGANDLPIPCNKSEHSFGRWPRGFFSEAVSQACRSEAPVNSGRQSRAEPGSASVTVRNLQTACQQTKVVGDVQGFSKEEMAQLVGWSWHCGCDNCRRQSQHHPTQANQPNSRQKSQGHQRDSGYYKPTSAAYAPEQKSWQKQPMSLKSMLC